MHTPTHTTQPMIFGSKSWEQRVREVYFNLNVAFRNPQMGSGRLLDHNLNDMGVSCLHSSAVQYHRAQASQTESYFLITLPIQNAIRMQQGKRDTVCERGHILLQHANEPYVFEYATENTLWVLKVPSRLLKQYIPHPETYTAMTFDGLQGIGRLFTQNVLILGEELFNGRLAANQEAYYTQFLLQLFAQVLNQDHRMVHSDNSNTRQAQLNKVQQFICQHVSNHELTPTYVAAACGISVRYLHSLFQSQATTFTRFLQQQRLQDAYDLLQQAHSRSITDIAYQCGFNDQSHFTRLFKHTYQITPLALKQQHKTP